MFRRDCIPVQCASDDVVTTRDPRGKRAVTRRYSGGGLRSGNSPTWGKLTQESGDLRRRRQLPAPEKRRAVDAGVDPRVCPTNRASQLWSEPTPPPGPPSAKKVWSKASDGPHSPSLSFPFPLQPNHTNHQTTKSPYHLETSTVHTKLRRDFSRCRRPSLSSKRPLWACQLTRARLQSSSLNEIPILPAPRRSFYRLSPSEPVSAPGHEALLSTTRRVCLRAENTGSTTGPRLLAATRLITGL
jgi:hypothetical protein